MGGGADHLVGGAVVYKVNLLVTIAQSSTEAEYMQSTALGKIILYARSIMWDLGVPQLTATIAYEDNDACTSMANARRPTSRTRHVDIKWHVLCQWIEQDLIKLERIPTALNIADIFTKQLGPLLFKRHCDYVMGRVPPQYSSAYGKFYGEYKNWADSTESKPHAARMETFPVNELTTTAARFVNAWFCVTESKMR